MDANFLSIIKKFNDLMAKAITGPNCIDPNICKGDCCSIKIDISKKLAQEYIKLGFASNKDFIRSDVFSFHLRFDDQTGKCFLFDKIINGCKVHNTGIKPPQCWIYPTNFSNPNDENISCKKVNGWKIIDPERAKKAEKLLEKYIMFCKDEATAELKNIINRLNYSSYEDNDNKEIYLKRDLMKYPPSKLAGIKDTWDYLEGLPAQGFSLQLKKFCIKHNTGCKNLPDDFMECKAICEIVADALFKYLNENLCKFIEKNGPDTEGEYPFYKLLDSHDDPF